MQRCAKVCRKDGEEEKAEEDLELSKIFELSIKRLHGVFGILRRLGRGQFTGCYEKQVDMRKGGKKRQPMHLFLLQ